VYNHGAHNGIVPALCGQEKRLDWPGAEQEKGNDQDTMHA